MPEGVDPRLRLLLYGGGHGDDFREVEQLFGSWLEGRNAIMLVAPGMHPEDVAREHRRVATNMREGGGGMLVPWGADTFRDSSFVAGLAAYGGICFCGALPHEIVPVLRETGLDRQVAEAARDGFVVYASNLLTTIAGPDARYTTRPEYFIGDYGVADGRGLGLTTDAAGRPKVYIGTYRAAPVGRTRHPQKVANETGARVCVVPPAGMVTICDGVVAQHGRRAFAWFEPKPLRRAVLRGSRLGGR